MRGMELLVYFLLVWLLFVSSNAKSYSRSQCFVQSGEEGDVEGDDIETDGYSDDTRTRVDYGEEKEEEEEADDEGEEEENEYGDRKKRSSLSLSDSNRPSSPSNITGKLVCRSRAREMIHVTKVVVGVSTTGWCRRSGGRCTDVVADHPVMFSCEGEDESCDILVERIRLPGCRRLINFVTIEYECLPDDSRLDICHFAETGRDDSVVVTSPAYPWVPLMHDGEYLTCECEISTDDRSVITMEYIQSEMSGELLACDDEFLLVEKRDPRNKRKFKVEDEICGSVRRGSHSLDDSLIRLTYMAGKPNTTDAKRGFLAKFKAMSRGRRQSRIQIKCEELSDDDNMVDQFGTVDGFGRLPGVSKNNAYPSITRPPPPDTSTRTRPTTTGSVNGSAAGAAAGAAAAAGTGAVVGGSASKEAQPTESVNGGVLSAVVASLVSIIVIMGSVGVYFMYKRKRRNRTITSSHGSLKSNDSWYRDSVYTDPVYTTPSHPPEKPTLIENKTPDVILSQDVVPGCVVKAKPEQASNMTHSDPPSLPPKAPPRRRRRDMDEVEYDNAPLTMVRLGASSSEEIKTENCYDNITDV